MSPDKWTIKFLYKDYQHRMSAIEQDYRNKIYEDYSQYEDDKNYFENKYIQAMRLIFSVPRLSYGYLAVAEDFIDQAYEGSFTSYDGIGYWIDWEGNKLGPFSFSAGAKRPEGAEFIAWYNK